MQESLVLTKRADDTILFIFGKMRDILYINAFPAREIKLQFDLSTKEKEQCRDSIAELCNTTKSA
jgi:hypothetical protein